MSNKNPDLVGLALPRRPDPNHPQDGKREQQSAGNSEE
jgi:hypothetical protein